MPVPVISDAAPPRVTSKAWVALWTVYIIWGSTYLAIAITIETLPASACAVSTRFILAGAIMAVVVLRRGGTMRITRREAASCLVIGCLLPGANAILFIAERTVPTGLASLLIASVPLWLVLLQLSRHERVPGWALVGVGVGFAGVAVLARPSGGATSTGIALCVLSAVMWAVGSVLSRRLPMPADPFTATSYEMLAGGFIILPFGIATMGTFAPSTASILGWIYLVTIGSVVGYTAYTWLLAHAPLGTVSTYAYVNPVVAIALGVAFRGEHLTTQILIGAAIVVAAVAVVVRQEPACDGARGRGSLARDDTLDPSVRDHPDHGDRDEERNRDPRNDKRTGEGNHVRHHRGLAFPVVTDRLCELRVRFVQRQQRERQERVGEPAAEGARGRRRQPALVDAYLSEQAVAIGVSEGQRVDGCWPRASAHRSGGRPVSGGGG